MRPKLLVSCGETRVGTKGDRNIRLEVADGEGAGAEKNVTCFARESLVDLSAVAFEQRRVTIDQISASD